MGGRAGRAVLPALAVLALVGVVAVAGGGSSSTGSGDPRPPGDTLLDLVLSLFLVALIPGAALLVYGLLQRKEIARQVASGRYPRTSLAYFLVFMLLFTTAVYLRMRNWERKPVTDESGDAAFPGLVPRPMQPRAGETTYEPSFAWLPILVVVVVAGVGVGALVLASRRRRNDVHEEGALLGKVADAVDDALADLRLEQDPRRAVIAAYARLERALAAHGLPRGRAETSDEFLARVLRELEVAPRSVRRLTELFARAKFSPHEIDERMKEEAIDALAHVRDELRATAPASEAGPGSWSPAVSADR